MTFGIEVLDLVVSVLRYDGLVNVFQDGLVLKASLEVGVNLLQKLVQVALVPFEEHKDEYSVSKEHIYESQPHIYYLFRLSIVRVFKNDDRTYDHACETAQTGHHDDFDVID